LRYAVGKDEGKWPPQVESGRHAGDSAPFTLLIDDQEYPAMDGQFSDCGTEVPLVIDDNGVIFRTTLVTDIVGRYFSSTEDGPKDSIRAQPVWFLYVNE
jgi:hypothetical protein